MPVSPENRSLGSSGFFYGYVIIGAGFLIQALGWGAANSFGVYYAPLIREFGWSRTAISGAVSAGFLLHGAASILIGNLSDRLGPARVMACCGLLLGSGFILLSQMNDLWQLYLFYGLIASAGLGGIDVIPLSTVSRWFIRKRGMMSGVVKVGTGLGMLVMPFFINWLITGYGWPTSFGVIGVIILVTIPCLASFLVRDPYFKGQAPDMERCVRETERETGLGFRQVWMTRQFLTVCAIYFIILFCVFTIIMHIVQHAVDLGVSSQAAGAIISIVGGVSIAGRLIMGAAGDRIGEKQALAVCLCCMLAALAWLQAVQTIWMFYLFAVVYGFAHGGFFALNSPLVARFFGTRAHGLLLGIVIFSSTAGGAIGPLTAGLVFDRTASYGMVFGGLFLACLIALGLVLTLKPVAGSSEAESG